MQNEDELKSTLQHYLRTAREAVLWKLDGLSEYRRAWTHSDATIHALPLDTTGTVPPAGSI